MRTSKHERGSSLLFVLGISVAFLGLILAVVSYSSRWRNQGIYEAKAARQADCAETGLRLAKSYFGSPDRYTASDHWNTFLGQPKYYNPVLSSYNVVGTAANPFDTNSTTAGHIRKDHPELFFDLDGDTQPDVYIYVRDNADELPPAANDWTHDNDQVVIVGAVCISNTLAPHPDNKTTPIAYQTIEALLVFNTRYGGQAQALGGDGTGNISVN